MKLVALLILEIPVLNASKYSGMGMKKGNKKARHFKVPGLKRFY